MLPLCVDLDGTLIKTDVGFELLVLLLRTKPWLAPMLPVWSLSGRAKLKRKIAEQVSLDVSQLLYNVQILAWLEIEKNAGRKLVLATASDQLVADKIEQHLALFDEAIGSDGEHNIEGTHKLEKLKRQFGLEFAYAGNSRADLPIWRECREAIVVNAMPSVLTEAQTFGNVTRVFDREPITPLALPTALGWKEWLLNLLVFAAPLIYRQPLRWRMALAAYFSFCLCSSGAAILRELFFVPPDRRNTALPIALAFWCAPALLLSGAALGLMLPQRFELCLVLSVLLSFFYARRSMISPLVLRLAAGWFAFIER